MSSFKSIIIRCIRIIFLGYIFASSCLAMEEEREQIELYRKRVAGSSILSSIPNPDDRVKFNLVAKNIGDDEVDILFSAPCCLYPRLQTIDLSINRISFRGAKVLSGSLPWFSATLTSLRLAGNPLGPDGVIELARNCSNLSALAFLDLSETGMRHGIRELARALSSIRSMQILYLMENAIGDEGMQALSVVLPDLVNLQRLNVGSNNIGALGLNALRDVVPSLVSLTQLIIHGNPINPESVESTEQLKTATRDLLTGRKDRMRRELVEKFGEEVAADLMTSWAYQDTLTII